MNFASIQSKIYNFLLNNTDLIENNNGQITEDNLYELFNLNAPDSNLNSKEGMEYLSNLMNEFLELEEVLNIVDTDKNGEISFNEKDNFLNEELDLNLSNENIQKLFANNSKSFGFEPSADIPDKNENIGSTPEIDESSGRGSGNDGGNSSSGTGGIPNGAGTNSSSSDDAKLKEAERKMNEAEKKYTDAVKEESEEAKKLEVDRNQIDKEIETKETELNTATTTVTRAEGELKTINGELSTLNSELRAVSSKKVDEDDENGQKEKEKAIKAIEEKIEAKTKEQTEKQEELDTANKNVTKLTTEIEIAKTKREEIETKISETVSPETKSLLTEFEKARNEYEKIAAEVKEKEAAEKAEREEKAKNGELSSEVRNLEDDADFTGKEAQFSKDKIYTTATGQQLTGEEVKENVEKTIKELGIEGEITYMESSDGQIVVKEVGKGFENRYRIAPDGDVIGYKTAYGSFEEDGNLVNFNHKNYYGENVKTTLPLKDIESYIKNIKAGNSNGSNVESILNSAITDFETSKHKGQRDHCVVYTKDVMAKYGFDVQSTSWNVLNKSEKVEKGSVQPGDIYLKTNYKESMNIKSRPRHVGIIASEIPIGNGAYCYITIDFAASGMTVNVHNSKDQDWYQYRKP